jgi:hypothetical protein
LPAREAVAGYTFMYELRDCLLTVPDEVGDDRQESDYYVSRQARGGDPAEPSTETKTGDRTPALSG